MFTLGLLIIHLVIITPVECINQSQLSFTDANLSSTFVPKYGNNSYTASNAIDGNLKTMAHSMCNTLGQEVWLKLWLRWPSWVDHFVIYPMHTGNQYYTRFQGARIYTKDMISGQEILCGTLTLETVSGSHTIKCGSVQLVEVVVVRLQKSTKVCIQLHEIQAFGEHDKICK